MTSLVDLRDALRARCQLDTADPRATDAKIDRLLNGALRRFQVANPFGWPWDVVEQTAVTLEGLERLPIAFDQVCRIRYIVIADLGGENRVPLERVSRAEQLSRFPLDRDARMPQTFSILGSWEPLQFIVRFRPVPAGAYPIVVGGVRVLPELAQLDAAYPAEEWADIVVEYAAYLVHRGRENIAEAVSAKASFDREVMRLRRSRFRVNIGAGAGPQTISDDPWSGVS